MSKYIFFSFFSKTAAFSFRFLFLDESCHKPVDVVKRQSFWKQGHQVLIKDAGIGELVHLQYLMLKLTYILFDSVHSMLVDSFAGTNHHTSSFGTQLKHIALATPYQGNAGIWEKDIRLLL